MTKHYEIELERDHMEITWGANTARADWRDNAEPCMERLDR